MLDLRDALTVSEAAARAGVSATWLRTLVRDGRLAPIARTKYGLLFSADQIDRLRATRRSSRSTPAA